MLVAAGCDLNEITDEMRAALTKLPNDERFDVSQEEYWATKNRRFGRTNPEQMNYPFGVAMIKAGVSAWFAKQQFADEEFKRDEIFCFRRFGKSITELPDERIVEIAGEHEDYYDPNFCIYNDVIVHHGDGTFDIYGYSEDVFPPTDFHTATLVGQSIYIIGNLGYANMRQSGETTVYRLDLATMAISQVPTSGDKPEWINRHKAVLTANREISTRGGNLCCEGSDEVDYVENPSEYVLDLKMAAWRKNSVKR